MRDGARCFFGGSLGSYDAFEITAERLGVGLRRERRATSGSSNESTSALDTYHERKGVCRDFAHVGIALCRALLIPARMVVGYLHRLQPPMDQHAWFEAFVNGRWYTFDATQTEPRGGRIVIAYGRDAADVAITNPFGPVEVKGMKVVVEQIEGLARS